jgi:hypothetical protein
VLPLGSEENERPFVQGVLCTARVGGGVLGKKEIRERPGVAAHMGHM